MCLRETDYDAVHRHEKIKFEGMSARQRQIIQDYSNGYETYTSVIPVQTMNVKPREDLVVCARLWKLDFRADPSFR